jgi:hypothetical protein
MSLFYYNLNRKTDNVFTLIGIVFFYDFWYTHIKEMCYNGKTI